jgi:hypothetical protein
MAASISAGVHRFHVYAGRRYRAVEGDRRPLGRARRSVRSERQHYRDRVLCLTLLRDNIVAGEAYVLDKKDLSLAELISPDGAVASEISNGKGVYHDSKAAIDGLQFTMPGEEVRANGPAQHIATWKSSGLTERPSR